MFFLALHLLVLLSITLVLLRLIQVLKTLARAVHHPQNPPQSHARHYTIHIHRPVRTNPRRNRPSRQSQNENEGTGSPRIVVPTSSNQGPSALTVTNPASSIATALSSSPPIQQAQGVMRRPSYNLSIYDGMGDPKIVYPIEPTSVQLAQWEQWKNFIRQRALLSNRAASAAGNDRLNRASYSANPGTSTLVKSNQKLVDVFLRPTDLPDFSVATKGDCVEDVLARIDPISWTEFVFPMYQREASGAAVL